MAFEHYDHGIELPKLTRKTTEEGRRYFTPTGEAYPSVTTVLGVLSKDSIQAWRKRVGEAEANRISTQASRRGTAVHKICENYIDNKEDWKEGVQPANMFLFNTMKKVLALMAIVGFVACNNAETKTEAVDSTKMKDSMAAAAQVDTSAVKVDSAAVKVDSAAKK